MNYQDTSTILGLQQGIIYGQNERVDELNDRIQSRHYPDRPLEPNYSPIPIATKYSLFPILSNHPVSTEIRPPQSSHNVSANFNPGTRNAPHLGYFNHIDVETILRNQNKALQHGADQGVYIPSSKSSLYNVSVPASSTSGEQLFPNLFNVPQCTTYIPQSLEQKKIGSDTMFNHTRTQLRNWN
jgi:hypothetical protein